MSTLPVDSSPSEPAAAGPWWQRPTFWLCLCLVLSAALVLTVGALTPPSVGDELVHYDIARQIFKTGQRPVYHELLQRSEVSQKPVRVDVLWHFGLAGLWYITGGVRQFTAQLYNAAYLVLLTVGTYLVCRRLYDKNTSAIAAIVACTIPMSVALSTVFHDDVAVGALSTLAFLAVVQRRYALTGLALGVATLLKRTTYLIMPALFVLLLLPDRESLVAFLKHPVRYVRANFWAKFKQGLAMGALALAIMAPDMNFRVKKFGWSSLIKGDQPDTQVTKEPRGEGEGKGKVSSFDVSSPISNPASLVTHPGLALLGGLGLYLVKRKDKARDYAVLLLAVVGGVTFLALGNKSKFILRYLLVLVPVLAILAALGIQALKSRPLRWALVAGCLVQAVVVSAFVYKNRHLAPDFLAACTYLRQQTDAKTAVLGVPATVTTFYSQRRALWGRAGVKQLLWSGQPEARLLEIAEKFDVDYVLVDRSRVYDDRKARHLGGWPKSFVRKIDGLGCLREVFTAGDVTIWKIDRTAPASRPAASAPATKAAGAP